MKHTTHRQDVWHDRAVFSILLSLFFVVIIFSAFSGCTQVGATTRLFDDKVITTSPGMTTLRNTTTGGHTLHTQDQAASLDVYDSKGGLALSMLSTAGVANTARLSGNEWVFSFPGTIELIEEYNADGSITKRTIIGDTVAQLQALAMGREAIREALLGISSNQLEARKSDLAAVLGITEAAADGLISGLKMMVAPTP